MITNLVKRVVLFMIGLFIMSLAVALSVKARLGVSPISCIPQVFSVKYPLTLGQLTMIFNVLLILLQMVILRKKYRPFQLIQLPVVVFFGLFIDFSLFLLSDLNVTGYAGRLFFCLLSCAILALGVFFEVKAGITYLPGEGVALALTQTLKIEFGRAKISVDSSMVIVGVLFSFLFFRQLVGAREGTILAAILVGYLVKFYSKHISFIDRILHPAVEEELEVESA